ncbi:MAG: hypothetical protein HZA53_11300 [Planctomycetes bacterium]|nr:hypothetical protein [Planctomycetota bacterium]
MPPPSSTNDARVPPVPADTSSRRWIRRVLALLIGCTALGSLIALCGRLHFRLTPDFAAYVRTHPASDALVLPFRGEGRVLAPTGDMLLGAGDAFDLPEDSAERCTIEIRVHHGDDILLHFRHRIAFVFGRDGATRTAFALRTEGLITHPDLRACVRIGVSDFDRLVGPDSARAGSLTYDVTLLAGTGASKVELVEAARHGDGELADAKCSSILHGHLVPWSSVPAEGLVHRVRQRLHLTAARRPDGAQSIGIGASEHTASTEEYSYEVQVTVRLDGGDAHHWRKCARYAWGGQAW